MQGAEDGRGRELERPIAKMATGVASETAGRGLQASSAGTRDWTLTSRRAGLRVDCPAETSLEVEHGVGLSVVQTSSYPSFAAHSLVSAQYASQKGERAKRAAAAWSPLPRPDPPPYSPTFQEASAC